DGIAGCGVLLLLPGERIENSAPLVLVGAEPGTDRAQHVEVVAAGVAQRLPSGRWLRGGGKRTLSMGPERIRLRWEYALLAHDRCHDAIGSVRSSHSSAWPISPT